jgi:hypothetical protein
MAGKKRTSKPKPTANDRGSDVAARAPGDELDDEQLVDHSGVFRVTTQLARAQRGRDDDSALRFPNESLVMAAQRDGFRDDGTTIDDALDDHAVTDDAGAAEKRQRLATLAARAAARTRPRTR